MAQRIVVQFVDDLDGTPLSDGAGGTVSFGLDGTNYEVDLSNANAERLRSALAEFVAVARKVGGRAGSRRSSGRALVLLGERRRRARMGPHAGHSGLGARPRLGGRHRGVQRQALSSSARPDQAGRLTRRAATDRRDDRHNQHADPGSDRRTDESRIRSRIRRRSAGPAGIRSPPPPRGRRRRRASGRPDERQPPSGCRAADRASRAGWRRSRRAAEIPARPVTSAM